VYAEKPWLLWGERNPLRLARVLDVASTALLAFPDIC